MAPPTPQAATNTAVGKSLTNDPLNRALSHRIDFLAIRAPDEPEELAHLADYQPIRAMTSVIEFPAQLLS
jgi:hypothetical protein